MALGLLVCCLAALLPAVMLYFPNMAEISFLQMLPYFGILAGLGVLAWAVVYLITRRKGLSAMAAMVWLLVLLNVGRLVPPLHTVFPLVGIKVIAPVTLAFLAAATYGLSRLKEEFLYDAAKVAAFALAAFILSTAVPALFSSAQKEEAAPAAALDIDLSPAGETDRPNFYWVIADEYAGKNELQKYYHYDNTPFYDTLREMKFTVSEDSYNWMPDTFRIFRDLLNMRYVDDSEGDKYELVADPDTPFWTLFRRLGYDVCEAESTNKFKLIDRLDKGERVSMPKTEDGETVANLLLRYSLLYRYEEDIIRLILPAESKASARETILNVFDWAENPDNHHYENPTFTIIYVQCPHVPYVFDRDGNEVPSEHDADHLDRHYYMDQLIYTTGRLEKICRTITETDPDSIIVLESDHGMRRVPNVTALDQCNILNAVYFRGQAIDEIKDKNWMNTWFAVLRKQFRLDIQDVEEKRQKNGYQRRYYNPDEEDPNKGLIPPPKDI